MALGVHEDGRSQQRWFHAQPADLVLTKHLRRSDHDNVRRRGREDLSPPRGRRGPHCAMGTRRPEIPNAVRGMHWIPYRPQGRGSEYEMGAAEQARYSREGFDGARRHSESGECGETSCRERPAEAVAWTRMPQHASRERRAALRPHGGVAPTVDIARGLGRCDRRFPERTGGSMGAAWTR